MFLFFCRGAYHIKQISLQRKEKCTVSIKRFFFHSKCEFSIKWSIFDAQHRWKLCKWIVVCATPHLRFISLLSFLLVQLISMQRDRMSSDIFIFYAIGSFWKAIEVKVSLARFQTNVWCVYACIIWSYFFLKFVCDSDRKWMKWRKKAKKSGLKKKR